MLYVLSRAEFLTEFDSGYNQQIVSDFVLGYLGKTQSDFLRVRLSYFHSFVLSSFH